MCISGPYSMKALQTQEQLHKAPCGRTLRTSALSSGASSLHGGCIRAAFDYLPLVIDHSIGRVPDAPYLHLTLTMRTDQGISTRTPLVSLPVGQPSNDLDRSLDHPLHLGQGRLNRHLHLGIRLGRLHAVIPDTLKPFGHRVLYHPADKRLHSDGFMFYPLRSVGAVMVRDPRAIIAINPPDSDRRAHHVLGHVARHALIL